LKREGSTHKANWLRQLLAAGLKPEVEVLETHFIAYFRSIGCRLTNLTDGGDGLLGRKVSAETRRRISLSNTGKKRSDLSRQMMSQKRLGAAPYNKGCVMSPEQRAKLSATQGGRPFVDQNGVVYQTQGEAVRKLGLCQGNVSRVLNGSYSATGGFTFKYAEAVCS
jgi:hypothetical protein